MKDNSLSSPKQIKQLMAKYGLRFHKGLGQNFLADGNIVRKIISAAELSPADTVVEVGPGIGVLTASLAGAAGRVFAIEKDKHLIPLLQETVARPNVTVINADILEVNWEQFLPEYDVQRFKVVANLPYYITTPILTTLLEERLPVELIVAMVQKEVAERVAAQPGSKQYGALTVFMQYFTVPEIAFTVPRTVFVPQPKVDSAVIKLRVKSGVPVRPWFSPVVKAAFGMRRKTLRNALSRSSHIPASRETVEKVLERADIDGNRRAETLSVEEFTILADNFGFVLSNPQVNKGEASGKSE